jgi:hypothetical protein
VLTQGPRIRLTGRGDRLRLRQRGEWQQDPLQDVRECCRAAMAIEKALGEAVRAALASGASWQEVGRVLGVADAAQSKQDLIEPATPRHESALRDRDRAQHAPSLTRRSRVRRPQRLIVGFDSA